MADTEPAAKRQQIECLDKKELCRSAWSYATRAVLWVNVSALFARARAGCCAADAVSHNAFKLTGVSHNGASVGAETLKRGAWCTVFCS